MTKLNNDYIELCKKCYDIEITNKLSSTDIKSFVKYGEKEYTKQIDNVIKCILKNKKKVIFIAGPSSSGKTTTSNLISKGLLKHNIGSLVVSIDDFFIDLEKTPLLPDGMRDFDNFTSVDLKTFNKFFEDIMTKHKAKMPRFNFLLHKRDKYETVEIGDDDIIIVEGIHALNPNLLFKHKFDEQILKLFICTNSYFKYKDKIVVNEREIRLMRRIYRDAFTRGRLPIDTIKQWKHVCEAEDLYISPYKHEAECIVDTVRPYELLIYANYLKLMLETYEDEVEIKKIINKFNHVNSLSKNVVPKNSLLWEFLVKND